MVGAVAGLNKRRGPSPGRQEFKTLTNLQNMVMQMEAIEKNPRESDIALLAAAVKELAREVDNVRQFATSHNHVGPAFLHTSEAWPYA